MHGVILGGRGKKQTDDGGARRKSCKPRASGEAEADGA